MSRFSILIHMNTYRAFTFNLILAIFIRTTFIDRPFARLVQHEDQSASPAYIEAPQPRNQRYWHANRQLCSRPKYPNHLGRLWLADTRQRKLFWKQGSWLLLLLLLPSCSRRNSLANESSTCMRCPGCEVVSVRIITSKNLYVSKLRDLRTWSRKFSISKRRWRQNGAVPRYDMGRSSSIPDSLSYEWLAKAHNSESQDALLATGSKTRGKIQDWKDQDRYALSILNDFSTLVLG